MDLDSSIGKPGEFNPPANRADLPDLARLSSAENLSTTKFANSPLLHHLEIAAVPIGAGPATGGLLGGALGLTAEAAVQVYKYPFAVGMGMLGGSRMAFDIMNTESRYMAMAGRFGAKGALIGAGIGAAAFAAYEIKNYFEK